MVTECEFVPAEPVRPVAFATPPESECPGCHEVKFVAHGPFCTDCFVRMVRRDH